ncbi:OsmC family protein [Conexibacter sp. CPCC 206217]|uniref:OsmC family protein n=1 Tax=Conexibacter sp. CPCC 206217 TaxID=3064574 RepID=UPI00271A8301|nr:OsmC family protein [Conexibacter sp. CPCC 206217]MDO8208826.1 OsmC family protein [Conexibacter sp. CPCC 206217]
MSSGPGLNGVDLVGSRAIAARFAAAPDSGRVPFGARVHWQGGYRTEVRFDEHDAIAADEPVALAGGGSGPSPEELLLGAIGHCIAVGWAGSAAAHGVELTSLTVAAHGRVNLPAAYGVADGHPGFEAIDVEVAVEAPGAPSELLDRIHARVVAQAPIPNTVAAPTPVTVQRTGGIAAIP